MARLLVALAVAGAVAGCGAGPAAPSSGSQPVASTQLAGEWAIDYIVDSCSGNRQCGHSLRRTDRLLLRLFEDGGAVTGAAYTEVMTPIEISGTRTGRFIDVKGARAAAFPGVVGFNSPAIAVKSRLGPGAMGEYEYSSFGPPSGDFFGNYVVKGTIVSAERLGDVPVIQSFDGRWSGYIAIGDCVSSGWGCSGKGMTIYEVTLSQTGDRVTGTMRIGGSVLVPVEGLASGEALRLEGTLETRGGAGSRSVNSVLQFEARRDRIGFLRGTFRHRFQYFPGDGRELQAVSEVHLWSVLRR